MNPNQRGSKSAILHRLKLQPSEIKKLKFRMTPKPVSSPFEAFDKTFSEIRNSADRFYAKLQADITSAENRSIQRRPLLD